MKPMPLEKNGINVDLRLDEDAKVMYVGGFSGDYDRNRALSRTKSDLIFPEILFQAYNHKVKKIFTENQVRTSHWLNQIDNAQKWYSKLDETNPDLEHLLSHAKEVPLGQEPGINNRWINEIQMFDMNGFHVVRGIELKKYLTFRKKTPLSYLNLKFKERKLSSHELSPYDGSVNGYIPKLESTNNMIQYSIVMCQKI